MFPNEMGLCTEKLLKQSIVDIWFAIAYGIEWNTPLCKLGWVDRNGGYKSA
jgi:hypothetical protein